MATHDGRIELIIGPMFSEKTTEMMSRVRRAAYAGSPALILKFRGDCRHGADAEVLTTHADARQASSPGDDAAAAIRVVAVSTLAESAAFPEMVVGIDEGQFFPDLVECCERWAASGRRVIVAALDGDFARRPFGQVCDLVPLCESVKKQNGVCMVCRRQDSAFTRRLGENADIVIIGAREAYRSVCRRCYAADRK